MYGRWAVIGNSAFTVLNSIAGRQELSFYGMYITK